jgi:plasmid stabilization system protein ParE
MDVKVRWSRQSRKNLVAIRAYIQEHNADAAEHVRWRIIEAVKLLRTLPRLGHAGRRRGTREFVIPTSPTSSSIITAPAARPRRIEGERVSPDSSASCRPNT